MTGGTRWKIASPLFLSSDLAGVTVPVAIPISAHAPAQPPAGPSASHGCALQPERRPSRQPQGPRRERGLPHPAPAYERALPSPERKGLSYAALYITRPVSTGTWRGAVVYAPLSSGVDASWAM